MKGNLFIVIGAYLTSLASMLPLWLDRLFAEPQSFLTYLYGIWVLLVALPLLLSLGRWGRSRLWAAENGLEMKAV